MSGPVLTATELLHWNDETAQGWKALLTANPQALDFPCDVYDAETVRGLLRHIFAVEIRYAQRLSGEPVTPYEQIASGSAEELFALHDAAVAKYRALLADAFGELGREAGVHHGFGGNAERDAEEDFDPRAATRHPALLRSWRRWCGGRESSRIGLWIFCLAGRWSRRI